MIYLLRHLMTPSNRAEILLGQRDEDIEAGQQIKYVDPFPVGCVKILCSPLRRSRQTALQALGDNMGAWSSVDFRVDPALTERATGDLTGVSKAEARKLYGEHFLSTSFAPHFTAPGGEDYESFYGRVAKFYERLGTEHDPSESIIISSHVHVFRVLRSLKHGLDPSMHWEDLTVPNGVFTIGW